MKKINNKPVKKTTIPYNKKSTFAIPLLSGATAILFTCSHILETNIHY